MHKKSKQTTLYNNYSDIILVKPTRRTKAAFIWIVKLLREESILFRLSGGFAARIYGSRRKLADIDIGIYERDIKRLLPKVKKYVIYGPKRYIDRNFNLLLMTLEYRGQVIDVYGNDKMKEYDCKNRKWLSYRPGLKNREIKRVYGLDVPIIPKKELIESKKRLGRRVDIEDVRQLEKAWTK
ncbi:MAG: hypothetical protein M1348_03610 [Candidatus Parvarchaeota archaeon]|jgi:hypothetical protein|nr:hypothetical protein [Candidatus Parvarchaeota archaeon]MCL5101668.1 hypothetical protein [Candidatus Parvarchaeota archaeon]